MENIFINKAEASGIISIDLFDYQPIQEIVEFDIKDHLFMGMIVKEKQFRESVSAIDYSVFEGKIVAVICSVDAIIPSWVYMLLAEKFSPHALYTDFTDAEMIKLDLWKENIRNADFEQYKDQKIVIKARSEIAPALYFLVALRLKSLVKTLMYGEIGMPKVIFKN